jgi:hypothetical protein
LEYWSVGVMEGGRFQPALVRYDRYLLSTARDTNNVLSSKIIES